MGAGGHHTCKAGSQPKHLGWGARMRPVVAQSPPEYRGVDPCPSLPGWQQRQVTAGSLPLGPAVVALPHPLWTHLVGHPWPLTFHPRRDPYAGGRLNRVRCQLKTTGGNCAGLVQRSLATLLQRLGLNPYFYFDGSHFQPRAPPKPQVVPKPRPAGRSRRGCSVQRLCFTVAVLVPRPCWARLCFAWCLRAEAAGGARTCSGGRP